MNYEFTMTLLPQARKGKSSKQQFEATHHLFLEAINGYKASTVTELTKQNDIHYHSMIYLKDFTDRDRLLNIFKTKYYKTFGRFTCTQIINEPNYVSYMKKSENEVYCIIGTNPWIKDDFKLQKVHFAVSKQGNIYLENNQATNRFKIKEIFDDVQTLCVCCRSNLTVPGSLYCDDDCRIIYEDLKLTSSGLNIEPS